MTLKFNLAAAFFVLGMVSAAAPGRPVVAITSVRNSSGNNTESMAAFIPAIQHQIVNTRKFDVCDRDLLTDSVKARAAEGVGLSSGDGRKIDAVLPGYIIRVEVVEFSYIASSDRRYLTDTNSKHYNTRIVANLVFANALNNKILASRQATADMSVGVTGTATSDLSGNFINNVMNKAIENIAIKVTDQLMELVYPVKAMKISGANVWLNIGQDRVKPGEFFNAYTLGEALIDPDTGESLGADETFVGQVQVLQTKPKFSIAAAVRGNFQTAAPARMIFRKASQEQVVKAPPAPINSQTNPF